MSGAINQRSSVLNPWAIRGWHMALKYKRNPWGAHGLVRYDSWANTRQHTYQTSLTHGRPIGQYYTRMGGPWAKYGLEL